MTKILKTAAALAALPLLALATGASAHAKLTTSAPAANATVAAPAVLKMNFDEAIAPKFSTATVKKADGSAVAVKAVAKGKTIDATPAAPLAAGKYMVMWSAVATDDGHKTTGSYSFTVK